MIGRRWGKEHLPVLTSPLLFRPCWRVTSHPISVLVESSFERPEAVIELMSKGSSLSITLRMLETLENPEWPDYTAGDAVELFIATRNWKNARSIHRFYHRILVFPVAIDGVYSREITELPVLERRQLMKENAVQVSSSHEHHKTTMTIEVPFDSLYQWDYSENSCGFAIAIYHHSHSKAIWWPGDGRPLDRLVSLWADVRT